MAEGGSGGDSHIRHLRRKCVLELDTETKTLTISGTGPMKLEGVNYYEADKPWGSKIKKVVIEEGVTSICAYAFSCTEVETVVLPESLTSIGGMAFILSRLQGDLIIPDSVTFIGASAFEQCGYFKTVKMPAGMKETTGSLFYSCSGIENLIIPYGVTEFSCSFGNTFIGKLTIPTSIQVLQMGAAAYYLPPDIYYAGGSSSNIRTVSSELLNKRWHYGTTAAEHPYKVTVITPATCTEDGTSNYTCSCGHDFNVTVNELGHSYQFGRREPTCTEYGYEGHTCVRCNEGANWGDYYYKWFAPTGHKYTSIVTPPTCTEKGYTTHTCSKCDDSYTDKEVAALGHDYKTVVTAPTCTEAGFTTYTCTVCGDSYTADEVPTLGHDYESVVTAPTCTTDGYTTHTCNVCGDSYTDAIVAAPGHAYETVVTDATCINGGYITHTCATCGDSYTDDETEALGHDLQFSLSLYPATCTREGKDIHSCGRYRCYYSEVVTLEADGHDYEAVVTDPTCTEAGYTTYTCTCGHSYVGDEVEATGHFYETAVTDPTCTEAGYTTYTCECGESYVDDEVEATGHSYEAVVTDPTCTEGGYTTYTCACGDSYAAEETEPTGHSYEAVVTEPTCTEKGYTTYTCACGDSYTGDETEALGHDNQEGVCSRCGEAILSIVSQSQSVWVPEGQKVTVTVEAEGDGLTYKWYYKNPGESKYTYTSSFVGNTYSVIMNEDRDGRYVYCKITDSYGNTVKSKTVSINMQTPLEILTQPKSVRVDEGATAKVTVKAQGDGLTYKWYYKNPGATKYSYTSSFTGNSYSITMNDSRDGRYVYCRVYDKYGNFIKTNTVSLRMK